MNLPEHLLNAKICNRDTCAEVEQLNSLVNSCQEEIRRLKEELENLKRKERADKDLIPYYQYKNKNLRKEIRRLKDCLEDSYETSQEIIKELEKENQRLNNIFNELEKWLKEERDYYFENYYYSDFNAYGSELEDVLNKLQELKESDK